MRKRSKCLLHFHFITFTYLLIILGVFLWVRVYPLCDSTTLLRFTGLKNVNSNWGNPIECDKSPRLGETQKLSPHYAAENPAGWKQNFSSYCKKNKMMLFDEHLKLSVDVSSKNAASFGFLGLAPAKLAGHWVCRFAGLMDVPAVDLRQHSWPLQSFHI